MMEYACWKGFQKYSSLHGSNKAVCLNLYCFHKGSLNIEIQLFCVCLGVDIDKAKA